jgi:3-deoxy-D-manno-octulosonic-acid transferase
MIGEVLSEIAARSVVAVRPLLGFVRPDLGRTILRRLDAARSLSAGLAEGEGTVVWVHGASAGELLAVAPIVRALRRGASVRIAVTHFSPSGGTAAGHLEPEWSGLPPPDTGAACDAALAAARPGLLIYSKGDVWPGLTAAAVRAGVPTALVNGVVRPGSRKLRPASRIVFRDTYARLDLVAAATAEDADRLRSLGARPEVTRVTGDAAFDVALERADRARTPGGARGELETSLPAKPEAGVRLVAGSTWGPDETALLDALAALDQGSRFRVQLVLVPHQPSEARVAGLIGLCRGRREPVERWSRLRDPHDLPGHGIVIFDEMGLLAELYTAGDIGYVGGGLGGSGLHNVLEPAAAGLPVLFGPRHDRREAVELEHAGGGRTCAGDVLAADVEALLDDGRRARMGADARAYVERRSGATAVTAPLLLELMGAGS